MNKIEEDVFAFQIDRIFKSMSRNILILFEDLEQVHHNNFDKLKDNLPIEFSPVVDMSDYLDANSYNYYRKKILDITNGCKRELESYINTNSQ